jgi:hypothetical protein
MRAALRMARLYYAVGNAQCSAFSASYYIECMPHIQCQRVKLSMPVYRAYSSKMYPTNTNIFIQTNVSPQVPLFNN